MTLGSYAWATSIAALELGRLVHPGDAQARAAARRLDEDRVVQRRHGFQAGGLVPSPLGRGDRDERPDRQSGRGQHQLHVVLVHPDRAGQHPGADVAGAHHLEQALDRAVLTERPVQQRDRDVDRDRAGTSADCVTDGELAALAHPQQHRFGGAPR